MSEYYMLNKPKGLITSKTDEFSPSVMNLFSEDLRPRIHPVGRLDIDTEGLLIFTDDGSLDNRLNLPERHVAKTYFAYVFGYLNQMKIEQLENGVFMCPNFGVSKPANVHAVGETVLSEIPEYFIPERKKKRYLSNPNNQVTSLFLTITEGKKHQVKLMLHAVGCHVFYLKRVKIGGLELDPNLNPGEYRLLTEKEVDLLFE